jgi:U3 small nucleolar RNA-associated protein 6
MASDKARFYLEQQVPELQEYERKQIFTREEIAAIAKKRSDFEHILNARGSKAADYVRYATYEMNLDSLRKKRCKRLGVKATAHGGQRTIFFILDRATKKFPGDLGLWVQYVQFCQKEKASKKLAKVFTSMLRLKPREWGLWVLAAKHYAEDQGDMTTARSYMQRGLRFCKDERRMYLEYAKLEMVYLAKLAARRKILGLDEEKKAPEGPDEEDDNMMMLPEISAEDLDPEANKGVEEVNAAALQRLANAPAYTGAIPLAIFDASMKQFNEDGDVANDFFDLVASFDTVPAARKILDTIYARLQDTAPDSADKIICEAKMHTFSVAPTSVDFPAALGQSIAVVKSGSSKVAPAGQSKLAENAIIYFLSLVVKQKDEMDEGVIRVLEANIKKYLRSYVENTRGGNEKVKTLPAKLQKVGKQTEGEALQAYLQSMG